MNIMPFCAVEENIPSHRGYFLIDPSPHPSNPSGKFILVLGHKKMFQSIDFLNNFWCSQIMVTCVRNENKLRVTKFILDIQHVENYPW